MIPKIIHYCWFGHAPKNALVEKCMESWKKHLPDYKIIEWNENNFDVNATKFTQEAYQQKKWAFVSDYARLYALQKSGGIYLDTDVEILKSLDSFLDNSCFLGYESSDFTGTAIIGAEKDNILLKKVEQEYLEKSFVTEDGELAMIPNPYIFEKVLVEMGFSLNGKEQFQDKIKIYEQIVFFPKNISLIWNIPSKKSFSIHHCDQSWRDEDKRQFASLWGRIRRYLVGLLQNLLGTRRLMKVKRFFKR